MPSLFVAFVSRSLTNVTNGHVSIRCIRQLFVNERDERIRYSLRPVGATNDERTNG